MLAVLASSLGSGVEKLWAEHSFVLRFFLACSILQWPLLVVLRQYFSQRLQSQSFVRLTDCLSAEAQATCDVCDRRIPIFIAAKIPFAKDSGCDVAKLVNLMLGGKATAQVTVRTCDLMKRYVLPKQPSQLPGNVTAASCMVAILKAMDQHTSSPEVQEQACWCLKNFASNNSENEVKLLAMGGAEAILKAIKHHAGNESVEKEGCVALAHLTGKQKNISKFLGLRADEWVLSFMQRHTSSCAAQKWGCQALANLAQSGDGRAKLNQRHASDLIQIAMANHKNVEVQTSAKLALERLAQITENPKNHETFEPLSCCPVLPKSKAAGMIKMAVVSPGVEVKAHGFGILEKFSQR